MHFTSPQVISYLLMGKRLVRTVLIFTESSDQLSRATDRVP
ncbi:AAA family ATPase, partial [Escherichia coli]|nr:AAA family ATPase [Escherichia coli]